MTISTKPNQNVPWSRLRKSLALTPREKCGVCLLVGEYAEQDAVLTLELWKLKFR